MSKWMLLISRLFRHAHPNKSNDGGRSIRQVVEGIRHNGDTVYHQSRKQLAAKQQQVAADSRDTGQHAISRPHLRVLHIFKIFYKSSYQKIHHNVCCAIPSS